MCYEMHQYTQKLSKTATNATVFLPHVSLAPLCWWCGTTPTTSITKLESAKSAVTGAVILSQMQKECVSLVSHLFYQLAALNFHTASMMTNICTASCCFPPLKGILCQDLVRLARRRQQQPVCPATRGQWSASIFYTIPGPNFIFNCLSVNGKVTQTRCCNKSCWYIMLFASKALCNLCDLAINHTFSSIYDQISVILSAQGHWLQ